MPRNILRSGWKDTIPLKYIYKGVLDKGALSHLYCLTLKIEVMALAVRSNDRIQGIQMAGMTHKLTLCADDVVFFCKTLYSQWMQIFDCYSQVSGYKINKQKSRFMGIHVS